MRITTDQPSSGKPLQLRIPLSVNSGYVSTSPTVIAEAPDFSIPGTGQSGVTLDPLDSSRELRPGEIFFESPLYVHNTDVDPCEVYVGIVPEDSSTEVPLFVVDVPPAETVLIPIQGLRLLKTDYDATDGDRLVVSAERNAELRIHGSASESAAPEHAPDSEA